MESISEDPHTESMEEEPLKELKRDEPYSEPMQEDDAQENQVSQAEVSVKHEEIQENYEEEFEQQQEEQFVPVMVQEDSARPHETLIEMGVEEPSVQEEE